MFTGWVDKMNKKTNPFTLFLQMDFIPYSKKSVDSFLSPVHARKPGLIVWLMTCCLWLYVGQILINLFTDVWNYLKINFQLLCIMVTALTMQFHRTIILFYDLQPSVRCYTRSFLSLIFIARWNCGLFVRLSCQIFSIETWVTKARVLRVFLM